MANKTAKIPTKKTSRFTNPLGLIRPSNGRKGVRKLTWKKALRYGLYALGGLVIIFIGMIIVFSFDLPKPGQIAHYHPTASTKIFDRNGTLLNDIYGEEKRTIITSQDIPKAMKDATVAIEDRSFYQHHGVIIRSIFRALFIDVIRHSKSQGGSTITQQLVRNAIDDVGRKKTVIRKIKEVILAIEFERLHSKDEILTLYLNEVPYGNNNYSIESAAQTYYGRSAKDLNPDAVTDQGEKAKIYAQIATLVSLPQSPTYYNPYGNHNDQLKVRRNRVLQNMADQGYLRKDMADAAGKVAITEGIVQSKESIVAPHFVFEIRQQLVDLLGGGQEGELRLTSGGYKVTTTLDVDKQRLAEQIIADKAPGIFKSTNASNAALVSTDAKTGQILAMVGSVDFNEKTFGSVNVTTAKRQPGSSFKPIVYSTLFKKQWSPASTLFDLESTYDQNRKGEIWPHNYSGSGRGPLTIRNTLAQSLNISAIKAQALAGTKESIDTARDLGISTLGDADQYGLSMVLGAAEVKMVDMVGAYGAFVNAGTLHPTSYILKIEDQNGQAIQEWKDQPKKALDENIAYEITSILSDNDARAPTFGSRSPLILPNRPVAAKTGTTSNYRDAWTIGYTPQVVTAVWVGNNNNKEMTHSGAGAMAAAPIWHDFMQKAHENLPVEQFGKPDSIKDCSITRYSNKKPTAATPASDISHDICADFQMPKDEDDTHKVVKVYKLDETKLATDATPPQLVLDKIFVTIHSERPDDPVWENPVQNWANQAGINSTNIPTDKYDPAQNDKLTLSILSPTDNATLNNKYDFGATAQSPFGVALMTFYIDDKQVAQPNAPWIVQIDTTTLANGKHTFKAVAKDLQDQETEKSASFTVSNQGANLVVSNVVATRSVDKTSVVITWNSSLGADGTVQYGLSGQYGSSASEGKGNVTSHSSNISGLSPISTYHFHVISAVSGQTATSPDGMF